METLSMSAKERRRLEVLCRVKSGEVSLVKAADMLAIIKEDFKPHAQPTRSKAGGKKTPVPPV